MYIDNNIPLPANMPRMLEEDFAKLQEYYDADDDLAFDLYWEGVEPFVKQFECNGRISMRDVRQIFLHYGISD